jgi:LysR family transcriptional regulator of abg operon
MPVIQRRSAIICTMKIHHLRYFAETAAQGSIRAAARALGLSQATVTQGLRELESHAQVSLLQRQGRSAGLTMAGQELLTHARRVLAQVDQAEALLARHRHSSQPQRLSIGVTPWVTQTLLSPTLAAFRQELPHIQVELFDGLAALTYPRLRDGSLDLMIGRIGSPEAMHGLQAQPLFSYEMTVVARRGHPRAAARSVAELLEDDWILNFMPDEQAAVLDKLFTHHGHAPPLQRIHLAQSAWLVLSLLQQTNMLSLCPWPLVEHDSVRSSLVALSLHEHFRTNVVGIVRRKQESPTHAANRFMALFLDQVVAWQQTDDPGLRRVLHSVDLIPLDGVSGELLGPDASNGVVVLHKAAP